MTSVIALFAVTAFQSPATASVMLKERNLSCADWAKVANHYIALGEQKAIEDLADRTSSNPTRFAISNTHACHIARLLYWPKPKEELRPPKLGAAAIVDGTRDPSGWPQFPFAFQNGVWFLIARDYQTTEPQEKAKAYLDYLKENGVFRKVPYAVPSRKQAEAAYSRLLDSPSWKGRLDAEFLFRQTQFER